MFTCTWLNYCKKYLLIDVRISGTQSAMIFMAFRSVVTCPGYCSLALHLPNARPTSFDPTNGSVLWSDIVYISPSWHLYY